MIHGNAHNPGPYMLDPLPVLPKHGNEDVMAYILRVLRVPEHIVAGSVDVFVVAIKQLTFRQLLHSFLCVMSYKQMTLEKGSFF